MDCTKGAMESLECVLCFCFAPHPLRTHLSGVWWSASYARATHTHNADPSFRVAVCTRRPPLCRHSGHDLDHAAFVV